MSPDIYRGPLPEDFRILFVDFDGTLKPAGGEVSQADIRALAELGRRGVARVVATGRGLFSFQRDFPPGLELDHLIFSSGLGLCPWGPGGPGPLSHGRGFDDESRDRALAACLEIGRGFYAFEPPPSCHRHLFQDPEGFPPTQGYLDRLRSYADFATPFRMGQDPGPRSEFLITAPVADMPAVRARFEALCPGLSLLCSSSPFGDRSMWLEIFPPGINKGQAAASLSEGLGLSAGQAVALGNDYNDLDLLAWAGLGLVTANGPEDLRRRFHVAPSVDEAPLAWLLGRLADQGTP
ncbi:MAG: Cof-type HAD-IIB family hydrolase [Deltaproteobacteria bacterium]|jgi:hydroxymethylpyrimidine pyrophosphatase-like HAD family hydrolase|nr:Cof-type HAD-IIB family hydrolase [Deltaproteobacteria bacterium]